MDLVLILLAISRKKYSAIKIIMISGFASAKDVAWKMELICFLKNLFLKMNSANLLQSLPIDLKLSKQYLFFI
jgi:hypothetical protein